MISQVNIILQALIPALGIGALLYGVAWFKKIQDQGRKNTIEKIDLTSQKIRFNIEHESIDDLVAGSNKSHGNVVGKKPGSDTPKG